MSRIGFVLPLLAALFSGCATTSNVYLNTVAGRWYGVESQPRESDSPVHWILERHGDGTFDLTTFEERNCKVVAFTRESGRWSLSNGLYSTVTTEVNGKKVDSSKRYYQDIYALEEVTSDRIAYTSIAESIRFVGRRVSEGFVPSPTMLCGSQELQVPR
jgi:hypothetical protein